MLCLFNSPPLCKYMFSQTQVNSIKFLFVQILTDCKTLSTVIDSALLKSV